MSWAMLSDDFYDHPKVRALPRDVRNEAAGLFLRLVSQANRHLTDGLVLEPDLEAVDARPEVVAVLEAVPRGFAAGLLERRDGELWIHDFAVYSKPRAEVERSRAAKAAAGKAGGKASGRSRRSKAEAPASRSVEHPSHPRPIPGHAQSGTTSRPERALERAPEPMPLMPDALEREGLPLLAGAPEVVTWLEATTGRGVLAAGDKQLTELDRQLERHGTARVLAALRAIADQVGGIPDYRQLVWGAMRVLDPIPRAPAPDALARSEADELVARLEAGRPN